MWPKFIIPLTITALAWLSVQWLRDEQAERPPEPVVSDVETPDAYMEGVVARRMDAQGRPYQELRAARLTHFATDDRSEFEAPFVTLYRADGSLWTLAAERGSARGGDRDILLSGAVVIRRPHNPAQPAGRSDMELRTRDLHIHNATGEREGYAETDQPITLVQAHGRIDAVGMKIWFEPQRVQLLSQVNGIYDATD